MAAESLSIIRRSSKYELYLTKCVNYKSSSLKITTVALELYLSTQISWQVAVWQGARKLSG